MNEMYDGQMLLWRPQEKHPYSKNNCAGTEGLSLPEFVRIYSSSQDVTPQHDTNCNHKAQTGYAKLHASSCDLNNDAHAQRDKKQSRKEYPDPVTWEKNNHSIESSHYLSPGHVLLSVPPHSPGSRRSVSQSSSYNDNSSMGLPATFPPEPQPQPQPQPQGSSPCLTAEIPLSHIDFWPGCRKRALMACDAKFEKFEVLVKRANKWLQQFKCYEVVSCETVDKKVIYVKDIYNAAMYFTDEDGPLLATHIKGLRIWYRHSLLEGPTSAQEVGFLDVTPRYLNPGEKHPRFETLPQTIEKINTRFSHSPLKGQVISVETVTLKIAREDWSDHIKVDPCHCQWYDEYNTHQLNFVRIFYLASDRFHSQQVIGIQDFTPDAMDEGGIFHPAKYASFNVLFRQACTWIQKNPAIRVTNFQSLDTKHRKKSENHGHRFNTDKMFEYRIEERFRAFFLRIGYVMRSHVGPDTIVPAINPSLACRMYLPYKKSTGYENITEMLQRVEDVIENTGAVVYHVETVPLPEWITKPEICDKGDIERTFFDGEWYFVSDQDGNDRGPYRYTLIYAIRVYFEGLPADYGIPMKSHSSKHKTCCVIL